MMADSGVEANCAVVVARFVARPAFCIPTSIEMVLFLAVFMPTSFPAPYPSRYPSPLCNRTAAKITTPDVKNLSPVMIQHHLQRMPGQAPQYPA